MTRRFGCTRRRCKASWATVWVRPPAPPYVSTFTFHLCAKDTARHGPAMAAGGWRLVETRSTYDDPPRRKRGSPRR